MIKENEDIPLETGKRYWKSLDDYSDSPQFREWLEREFPQGASMLEGVQRRGFMKLMAASFGLAGLVSAVVEDLNTPSFLTAKALRN